ncbi:MAG: LamG domain-containing protein [Phycisphaerales bacterium]
MKKSMIVLAASASFVSAAFASNLTNGLVAFFPFEGTPYDGMNHCYTVTQVGSPTYARGAVGRAMRFDGDDGLLVDHTGQLSFDMDTDSYSLAFYCKWDGGSNEQTIIQDRYGGNVPVSYNFGFNGGVDQAASNTWYGMSWGDGFFVSTPKSQFVNEWRHVAVTYDATSGVKTLYIDGILIDSEIRPNHEYPDPGNTRITIGSYWGSCGCLTNFYHGLLDELRIYNRVLSQGEITELVELEPCLADYNGDGFINGDDFDLFAEQFEAGGCN